jgi:hypothetical protein
MPILSSRPSRRDALYDNTFQQYGLIFIMDADGSGKRMLTDSRWKDSMPFYIAAKVPLRSAGLSAGNSLFSRFGNLPITF